MATGKSSASKGGSNGHSKSASKKPNSQAASDLRELLEDQLKDIYWAEKALTKALPKMAKQATAPELISALEEHLAVTQTQVTRLESVFEILGKKAQGKKCDAMEGLIKEGEGIVEDTQPGAVRDAGIIGASQKIEHYEIASYGTMAAFATLLGEEEVAQLLQETLAEEKEADVSLTVMALNSINLDAIEEDDEEDEESQRTNGSKKGKLSNA